MKRKDMKGQKWGFLKVVEFSHIHKGLAYWLVECDCGKIKAVCGSQIRRNKTTSCGCIKKARLALGPLKIKKHGMCGTATYRTWASMKARCYNERNTRYYDYGGRGIKVCKRWDIFENFLADMGVRPKGVSIDRRDNHRGYSPDNCYWATPKQQQNNMRSNINLEYQGVTKTLSEWAEHLGINHSTLYARINRSGWSIKKAFTTKKKPGGRGRKKEK